MSVKKQKEVTLKDLGKRLNLSPRAVSQALNDEVSTVRVSDETRKRVKTLAKRLDYRPAWIYQTIRTGKSGRLGVLAVQAFGHLLQQRIYLARQYADLHKFVPNIYIIPDDSSEKAISSAVNFMMDNRVEALVSFNDLGRLQTKRIHNAGVPYVTIDVSSNSGALRYIGDQKGGFSLLTKHLIDQGASILTVLRDSFLPLKKQRPSFQALEGVDMAIRQARKEGKPIISRVHTVKISFEGWIEKRAPHIHGLYAAGYLGMKEIILAKQIPHALICPVDNFAYGALLACAEYGIRIPQDMMIAGFGDDPLCSAGLLTITSVKRPLEELCRLAFDDLTLMAKTGRKPVENCVVLPCELVIRQSTQRISH